MKYSSKDFAKTGAELAVEMPEKLIHRDICSGERNEGFDVERKHPVHIVDVDSRTMSMTIGILAPGQNTNRHRHAYETIIYIEQGEGFSVIENQEIQWRAGDAIYVPVWAWHSHHNTSQADCRYIACENTPLLQNLGLAIREES